MGLILNEQNSGMVKISRSDIKSIMPGYNIPPTKRKSSTTKESDVHSSVCRYIRLQYPNVMFLSDFGAGIKLTQGMAARQNMQKSNHSFPDLMIFEPRGGYHGLFLELKRDRNSLYKKNGDFLRSDHIDDQRQCLHALNRRGYAAYFACGLDEAKNIIDDYMVLR